VFTARYGLSLNILQVNLSLGHAMAQAVSRRLLTTEARVRSQVSPREICGWQSDTGRGFSPSSSIFPCQYQCSTLILISCSYQDKCNTLALSRAALVREVLHFVSEEVSRTSRLELRKHVMAKTIIASVTTASKSFTFYLSQSQF
jgi:hypothetical protein